MRSFTALLVAAAAATTWAAPLETRALSAIVPPQNPPANGAQSYCTSQSECLTIINNVRSSQEGLAPIKLPSNWNSLTLAQRLFTFINMERISRGLNPLTHLVNTYDAQIKTAIANDADPVPPSNSGLGAWSSIWAGGTNMIPLAAMYGWMYYDGPGGYNGDCTSADDSGCWGHRDNILSANMNKLAAGCGTDSKGWKGAAALLFAQNATPSASAIMLDWATESTKCT